MDKKKLLFRRLAGYSATAAAMTALTSNVAGQTYSGIKNIVIDNSTVNIDLDNDGANDFSFENKFSAGYSYNSIITQDAEKNKWMVNSSLVSAFNANNSFPYYSTLFTNGYDNLGDGYWGTGNFAGQGDKFIAVKFSNSVKLGWIRINIPQNNEIITIRDWAYTDGGAFSLITGSFKPLLMNSGVSSTSISTARLTVSSNATDCIVYFAVQLAGETSVPTVDEIKAGTGFIDSGNGPVPAALTDYYFNINGLSELTEYSVFYFVENSWVTGNISDICKSNFGTPDETAPSFTPISFNDISGNGAIAKINPSEDCTIYYAVLPASETAPNSSEIINGTGFTFAGNGEATYLDGIQVNITGLASDVDYKIYVVGIDNWGNESAINTGSFRTLDITAPVLSEATIDGISLTGATVHLTSNEAGTVYFAVLPSEATAPTVAEIKAGSGFTTSGNNAITASTQLNLNITGLAENTSYTFYAVALDANENESSIRAKDFSTLVNPVKESISDEILKIFPNPAHGSVQIVMQEKTLYRIMDISGAEIMSGKLEKGATTLDISQIPAGNYFIVTSVDGKATTKKLMIK